MDGWRHSTNHPSQVTHGDVAGVEVERGSAGRRREADPPLPWDAIMEAGERAEHPASARSPAEVPRVMPARRAPGPWGSIRRRLGGRPLSLYTRVVIVNAAVLVVATAVLAATPKKVSFPRTAEDAVVLAAGVALIILVNAILLRVTFSSLARLVSAMRTIDLLGGPAEGCVSAATRRSVS